MRLALEVAEHDRVSELGRKPIELIVEQGPQVEVVSRVRRGRRRPFDLVDVGLVIPRFGGTRPLGGAISHAAEPGGQRLAHADRTALAHQDEERRLERILHVVPVAENLPADPQHHGPMAIDQLTKCRFGQSVSASSVREPPQELGIAKAGESPGSPEGFDLPFHFTGVA